MNLPVFIEALLELSFAWIYQLTILSIYAEPVVMERYFNISTLASFVAAGAGIKVQTRKLRVSSNFWFE
jgi:hypothetical protein